MTGVLAGKSVLITGAGAGIGRGLSLEAAAQGAHVIVASLGQNGEETVDTIHARGGTATWVVCDVTDPAAIVAAVDASVRESGRLDAVVHNAMARPTDWDDPRSRSVADLTVELWEHQAAVAVRAAYRLAVASYPHLRAGRGRFVLMTSAAGIEGSPAQPAYAACKGAIRGMAKSLAREWGRDGITVNTVMPFVGSPSFDRWWNENPGTRDVTIGLTALGYLGEAEADVAPAMVFLLSDASRYMTGQTLVVDAGRYMSL